MKRQNKSLSIGIVSFNHEACIERTLASIANHLTSTIQTQIILWDNGSHDNTVALAKKCAEATNINLEIIQSNENLGFGQAHNKIVKLCRSDFHLIYNPDLYATEHSLEPLLELLENDSSVTIAVPKFLYPNGALQPLCRRDPSVLDLFLRFFAIGPLKRLFSFYLRRGTLLDIGYDHPMDVPITSGALMCIRTCDFHSLGGFDSRFFVYFEDYDLCRRIRRRGLKIRYTPASRFIHEWKRESRRNFKAVRMLFSGAFIYFQKWGVRWI